MSRVVLALEAHTAELAQNTHPLLGPATCTIGTIHGGNQVNMVPDTCCVEMDRRLLPGEEVDSVLLDYERFLSGLRTQFNDLEVEMEPPMLTDVPLETLLRSR
jgi:acetylornithine deacetylase